MYKMNRTIGPNRLHWPGYNLDYLVNVKEKFNTF